MRELIISKSELNGKTVIEYLNEKYDTVKDMRGYSYKLDGEWVEVLTDEDIIMNEIIRKSFFRCWYGYKLDIDITPIKDRVNKYLKNNTEINSKKYFEKDMYGGNIIEDRIYDLLSSKKWDIIEMLGY
tara:strand:+ start:946 stop:1329 length:384 start_codon:yes stop_codon:yes gene_type:complete